MSVYPTINTTITRGVIATGTVIASLALAGPASAAEPTIQYVAGNPSCASLGSGYSEVKFEPVPQGRSEIEGGFIRVRGVTFEWSLPAGVDVVVVKGGPNANVYRAENGDELTGGSFFHAPINPENGTPYGLSHISFCSDGKDAVPASSTSTPGPCEPGGPATMPDGSACDGEAPKSCDKGGTTKPDGTPCEQAPATSDKSDAAAAPTCTAQMADGTPCTPAPAPQAEVLGQRASGGAAANARLGTPRACVSGVFRSVVRGKGIRRVTFFVNGKRISRFAGGRSRYVLRLDPAAYPAGVMRVVARVQFVKASRKGTKTLRATVLRCAVSQQSQAPSFTG